MLNARAQRRDAAGTYGYQSKLPFAALLLVVVSVELAAVWLAYHTLGAVPSGMLFLALALNLVPLALYARRRLSLAVLGALLLFAAIVPYQAMLGARMLALHQEAGRIVAHLYETRLRTGEYPPDLSGYSFQDPRLQAYFQEYRRDAERGGFGLYWYVGTPSTSHSYTPRDGWGYYPD